MIDQLLRNLSSSTQQEVEDAIIALGDSGETKAVAPLVRSLNRFDQNPTLKALVCDALGELGDLRATQALLSQLRDPHPEVSESAFTALFTIGERRANAMPSAETWANGFAEPTEALTQIAWQTDHEAVQLLLKALREQDTQVKIGALYTLGQLGFVGALSQISALLADPHDEVGAAAAYSLGELARLGSSQTVITVCQILHQAWQAYPLGLETRIQVLRAAAECHSEEPDIQNGLAEIFVSSLSHNENVIRQLAVIGLGRLGDDRALPWLEPCLQDEVTGVRRNTTYAIGALSTQKAPDILVRNASEQPSEVRVAMSEVLQKAPREKSLSALYQALNSSDVRHRAVSVFLLGGLKDKKGLLKGLQDEASTVRKSSALAVGSAGLTSLSPTLTSLLSDSEWRVRAAVAEGLKRLRDSKVLPALESHYKSESHPVVMSALESAIASLSQPI